MCKGGMPPWTERRKDIAIGAQEVASPKNAAKNDDEKERVGRALLHAGDEHCAKDGV
jgi:hypothetical protein